MKFISIDYYISGGFKPKVPQKRFVNIASEEEKKRTESSKKYAGNNIKYTQRIHYSSS
jgi:hypothetical protein